MRDPVIYACAVVHESVTIAPFSSIGSEPFYFTRAPDGGRMRKEATGRCVLEANVEVFEHANIDRGATRDTVIGKGTKIDRHVHIGHDSIIGEDCVLTAHCIIGGYVEIGARTTVGLNAVIKPLVKVGKDCYIGMGAVVLKDVPDNTCVAGNPAHRGVVRQNWPNLPWNPTA